MAKRQQPKPEPTIVTKHTLEAAPRHDHIVQGATVQAPHVYAEGHQLSASEAGFLNRALINKVGSGLGQKLKKAAEKAKTKIEDHIKTLDLQAAFDEHFAEFDMDATRERGAGGGVAHDAVAVRARDIAAKQLKELPKIKAAGVGKLMKAPATADSGFSSKWTELVAQYLAKRPDITELAKSQIEAERAMVSGGEQEEDFDALLDSIETPAEPAAAE